MIRVSRDRAELGDVPFIWFMVLVERRNASSEAQATVRGACSYYDPVLGRSMVSENLLLSVEEAFKQACDVAKKKGFSAVWIDDPDRRFDFEPWERIWLG